MNSTISTPQRAWWRDMEPYHWFVLIVASAAWFFDCLDQRLFSLARNEALRALAVSGDPQSAGKQVTAIFLIGWGVGGLIFGALGDRYGRARMLTITVLLYSACTGLTFFSHGEWDFALFRFLTGLGIGGVLGLAVALIAETVPPNSRAGALGTLQVLSTIGNVSAGLVKMFVDNLVANGTIAPGNGWRWVFLVGAMPAFLVIFIQKYLREPEPWLKLKAEGRLSHRNFLASYVDILTEKRWRRNLIVGTLIASTGVVSLWAIGEYAVDLQRNVFTTWYREQGFPPDQIPAKVSGTVNYIYMVSMLGGGLGMTLFTILARRIGRRTMFGGGFLAAMIVTILVYWKMSSPREAVWMMLLMSSCQFALFAGFAIYLPELFPSRLRSTGTSFCYNLGRFAAAGGSLFSAAIADHFYGYLGSPFKERYSAMTMCAIFLVGLLAVPFAPETKDKPLPED